MLSLHQLRCFLSVYEHGSLTGAAEELGYAQPSVSEQIRALEKSLGRRSCSGGSGAASSRRRSPTRCVRTPSATLAAAEEARRAVQRGEVVRDRDDPVRDVRHRAAVRRRGAGRRRAGALPRRPRRADRPELHRGARGPAPRPARGGDDRHPLGRERGHARSRPVARDELVYISADPERLATPGHRRSGSPRRRLVMPETTWRATDSTRIVLRQMLHETGRNPQTRIEVEDVETAVELVGLGLADSVIPRGAAEQLLPRLAPNAGWVVAAAAALRHLRDRAPRRRHPLPRRPADDRARHEADPGHRAGALGS